MDSGDEKCLEQEVINSALPISARCVGRSEAI